jgi:hypothetical protein
MCQWCDDLTSFCGSRSNSRRQPTNSPQSQASQPQHCSSMTTAVTITTSSTSTTTTTTTTALSTPPQQWYSTSEGKLVMVAMMKELKTSFGDVPRVTRGAATVCYHCLLGHHHHHYHHYHSLAQSLNDRVILSLKWQLTVVWSV